jgi:hypothetical protein
MDFNDKEFVELFASTGELTDEGATARTALAAALRLPLNREIEKKNMARTLFMVDYLDPDAPAVYPLDIDPIDAWVLPRIGMAPQNIVGTQELTIPTFEITDSIEWKLQLARQRRINILQRKTLSLRNAIVKLENSLAWQVIRAAVKAERTVNSSETTMSKAAYNEGFQMMESKEDYRPDLVIVNPKRAGDIRTWGAADLDPVTMREVWRNAGVGNIWGADILIDADLADNESFFIDTTRMGIMPIRLDFVTYDDPTAVKEFRQRVLGYEEIGFAVVDPDAIVKVQLS